MISRLDFYHKSGKIWIIRKGKYIMYDTRDPTPFWSSPGFWIFIGIIALFKGLRRLFFWGSVALWGWAFYLYYEMGNTPGLAKVIYTGKDTTYLEFTKFLMFMGLVFFVIWLFAAIVALIGRKVKEVLS